MTDKVFRRLEELAELSSDWDGYGAQQLDRFALQRALDLVSWVLDRGLPVPQVFPLANGGIQVEWSVESLELDLELEPGGRSAVFVGDDRAFDQQFDGELPADLNRFQLALQRLAAYG